MAGAPDDEGMPRLTRLAKGPYDLHELTADLTLLPFRYREGMGVYPNGTGDLVKELRAAGLAAEHYDPPERRNWQKLLGDVTLDLLFAIGTGVAANALWAVLVRVLVARFGGGHKATVRLARQHKSAEGEITNEWFLYEGPVEGLKDCWKELPPDE